MPARSTSTQIAEEFVLEDLRGKIFEELALSKRIVREGIDVLPRFRIFAHDGPHVAFVQIPEAFDERIKRFEVIRMFMGMLPLSRHPVEFGDVQWLEARELDETITGLLPPKTVEVTLDDIAFMKSAFEDNEIAGINWQNPSTLKRA